MELLMCFLHFFALTDLQELKSMYEQENLGFKKREGVQAKPRPKIRHRKFLGPTHVAAILGRCGETWESQPKESAADVPWQ